MAGSNQPPKEGSREQLERDNQTRTFTDTPFSVQGGAKAETESLLPTLDDAIEEAMRDADPTSYRQGLREEASINTARVFAAGSLIAALGSSHATPHTHSEPTNQASDYTPYGHDEDLQTRIGNEHMAGTAEGKIAGTIGAQKAEEYYQEEKKKKEEEQAVYVAAAVASAAEQMWDAMWENYDNDYNDLMSENIEFNAAIDSSQLAINDYLTNQLPQHRARVDAVDVALNDGTTEQLQAQAAAAPPGSQEAVEAQAAVATRQDAAGTAHGAHKPEESLSFKLREAMNATEQAAQSNRALNTQLQSYMNQTVADATAWHERIPGMSAEQAKQELLQSYKLQAADISKMSAAEAKTTLVQAAESNIRQAEAGGNTDLAEQWKRHLETIKSETGEQAKERIVSGIDQKIQGVSQMSDEAAKAELLKQAQYQVDYARSVQSQAQVITQQIEQATKLSTELEEMRTKYHEQVELLSRDGLSPEEAAKLREMELGIFHKNNELAVLNGKTRHNEQKVYDSLKAQTANFNLGAERNAAARQQLEQTLQQAKMDSTVSDVANEQARQGVSQNVAVAEKALDSAPQQNASATLNAGGPEAAGIAADRGLQPAAPHPTGEGSGGQMVALSAEEIRRRLQEFASDMADRQSRGASPTREELLEMIQKHGINENLSKVVINAQQAERGEATPSTQAAPQSPSTASTASSAPLIAMDFASKPVTGVGVWSLDELERRNPQSSPLFGYSSYSLTQVPVTNIADPGYTGSPLMSDYYGVTGGSYSSFCESPAFTDYNPTPKETGGVTPSYEKPWYSVAWDATSDFMSSIFSGKDATKTPTIDPLGIGGPQTMLASADPTKQTILPTAGQGSGGGGMAA